MNSNFLIVDKSVLPDYFEKVLLARHSLENGEAKDVSQAAKLAGISRSTYYKYKDCVYEPFEMSGGRKAVMAVTLSHEQGMLNSLLTKVTESGCNVLTITQSLPVGERASVTLSVDTSTMNMTVDELLDSLGKTPGIEKPMLLAIE